MNRLTRFPAIVGLLVLLAVPAWGQYSDVASRLQDELERTDEIIERARETVAATKSSKAKLALEQAVRLQNGDLGARYWFRQGAGNNNYQRSLSLTLKARDRARIALSAARATLQNDNALLRKLERAEEYLERVREMIQAAGDRAGPGVAIYQSAKDNLNRAWEFYRSNAYRASLKLVNQVERAAKKLINAANRLNREQNNYERRAENVGRLLDRTAENIAVCDSEPARRLMEQARQSLQIGDQSAAKGKYKAAQQALQTAHEMAVRASRECGGIAAYENRYEELRQKADRLAEQLRPDDRTGQEIMNQVQKQLSLAREYLDHDRDEAAVAALKGAELTLRKLEQHLTNLNG